MNVIFLGPPGSGKGTQAKSLAGAHKLAHLSTGDIFREAIGAQTELGLEIKAYVDNGKLVPDELVSRTVFEKLKSLGGNGFLLDGYPRTVEQAKSLDQFSKKNGIPLDLVLFFDVAFPELVKRLSARRQCPGCKEVYNLAQKPPKKEGLCDNCGGSLIQRPDDQEAIVQERLKIYTLQTEPVLAFYSGAKNFVRIDAAQSIEAVNRQIGDAVKAGTAR